MNYLIDAWLENGVPQLSIRDADTGVMRLRWARTDPFDSANNNAHDGDVASRALQRLFKDLVKLSCADKLDLTALVKSPARDEKCLTCDACIARSGKVTQGTAPDNVVSFMDRYRALKRGGR